MRLLHILVAEDNRADVLLIRAALREHRIEHELQVVEDGAEAIEYVERIGADGGKACPDVVLLDLNLPKVEGPQVLKVLRRHPKCAGIPVIVVSSSEAMRDREEMARLGVSHYFRKPSDFDEFMKLGAVVRRVAEGANLSGKEPAGSV